LNTGFYIAIKTLLKSRHNIRYEPIWLWKIW